jgi:urease accessory protein
VRIKSGRNGTRGVGEKGLLAMKRASQVKPAGDWNAASAIDCVTLDAQDRHRRRVVLTGERGTSFLLDLPQAIALRDGDGLVLDDGGIVRVAGRPEPLVEIAAADPRELARFAWHIGNRHLDVQIVGERLRIRRDHVIEDMLRGLGARLMLIEAPFDPEPGAYGHHHGQGHGNADADHHHDGHRHDDHHSHDHHGHDHHGRDHDHG